MGLNPVGATISHTNYNLLNKRIVFGKGENLIIASDGSAASYMSSEEARRRIYAEKQEKPVDLKRIKLHGKIRALLVYNMHRLGSSMLDIIFNKKHYDKNRSNTNIGGHRSVSIHK